MSNVQKRMIPLFYSLTFFKISQWNLSTPFSKRLSHTIRCQIPTQKTRKIIKIFFPGNNISMSSCIRLEVQTEDQIPQKWCISLAEDVFKRFISQGNLTVVKVFGEGSLFSPLLFGKFFDPSDAFPLWDFESDSLLCNLRNSGKSSVDWFQTDQTYVVKAELPPGVGKTNIQIHVEKGKIVEISGQLKQQIIRESRTKDWRSCNWWEYGYVRRLELPDDADCRRIEAFLTNDVLLEIRIPRNPLSTDTPEDQAGKNSQ